MAEQQPGTSLPKVRPPRAARRAQRRAAQAAAREDRRARLERERTRAERTASQREMDTLEDLAIVDANMSQSEQYAQSVDRIEQTVHQVASEHELPAVSQEVADRYPGWRYDRAAEQSVVKIRNDRQKGDPVQQLRDGALAAQKSYMKSLKKSGVLDEHMTKPMQRQEMSELHRAYTGMMAMQLITPLQRGLSISSVTNSLGMGVAMYALSPNFREMMGQYTGQIAGDLKDKISLDTVTELRGQRAQQKLDRMERKTGTLDEAGLTRRQKAKAAKWTKRIEKYEKMQKGGREPFTEHSAALTQVGLAENAYWKMREPGADVEAIQAQYTQAMDCLYEDMALDGVDRGEMEQNMRAIVGQRLEQEPELAQVFSQTAQGRYDKSAPQKVFLAGTGQEVTAWTGDFYDVTTGKNVVSGTFDVRPPQTEEQHMQNMVETMWGDLADAKDVDEFNDVLNGYMVGSAVQRSPQTIDLVEDPAKRTRLRRAQTMFAAMEADGIAPERQHEMYKATVIGALSEADKRYPELSAEWAKTHGGKDWTVNTVRQIKAYMALGEQAGIDPEVAQQQTEHETSLRAAAVERAGDTPVREAADHSKEIALYVTGYLHQHADTDVNAALRQVQLGELAPGNELSQRMDSLLGAVQRDVESEEMQRLTYAAGVEQGVHEFISQRQDLDEQLKAQRGENWQYDLAAQTADPAVFIPPQIPEGASLGERKQMMVSAMRSSMLGHMAELSQPDAPQADPPKGIRGWLERRAEAKRQRHSVAHAAEIYGGLADPQMEKVTDQQMILRREAMYESLEQQFPGQQDLHHQLFSNAVVQATTEGASVLGQRPERLQPSVPMRQRSSWAKGLYQRLQDAARDGQRDVVLTPRYRGPEAETQHQQVIEQEVKTPVIREEMIPSSVRKRERSRRAQINRENQSYNGIEAMSGRFAGTTQDEPATVHEPELG